MFRLMAPLIAAGFVLLAGLSYAQDRLDLRVFDDLASARGSTAANAVDSLDLSVFDVQPTGYRSPVTRPGQADSLDINVLNGISGCSPIRLPDSQAAAPELQRQVPGQSQLQAILQNLDGKNFDDRYVAGVSNPTRKQLIDHLTGKFGGQQHSGKFSIDQLAVLSDAQLKQLHDRDHDAIEQRPAVQQVPRTVATTQLSGMTYYWPSEGVWKTTPQPGVTYFNQSSSQPRCVGGVCYR